MKIMRNIFFGIFLLSATATYSQVGIDSSQVDYSNPQKYEIAGVTVNGVVFLDAPSLIQRSGLLIGSEITIPGDAIARAIQNLWKMRLFSTIEIQVDKILGSQVWLIIQLDELPRISKYSPGGLTKTEEEDIVEEIGFLRGAPYTDYIKKDIENKVKDYFAEKGFLGTEVIIYSKPDTAANNSVIVFIDVTKGPKTKIGEITFLGNENVSDRILRKAMRETKVKSQFNPKYNDPENPVNKNIVHALSNLSISNIMDFVSDRVQIRIFSSSKYDDDNFRTDKNGLIALYNTLGYRDARIIFDTVYNINDRDLGIVLNINEGNKYYFRNITWKGNAKYSNGKLDSILGINKGAVYNQALLEQKLRYDPVNGDVTSLYMDDGYLFFDLNPIEKAIIGDSIDLEIRIREGAQAIIDQIIIRGNTKTNEHVIRRELRTLPGQKFSRTNLIRSQREIASLGYFDAEQIGLNPIPHPESGTVDIEYTVVEKPSDQLELSAGFSQYGVVATVGIVLNNWSTRNMFKKDGWKPLPTGDGQSLSFRINTNGRRYQSYNIGFVEPWLGGKKPNSLSFSLYRTFLGQETDFDYSSLEGHFITNGISVGYGIRLKWPDDYFTLLSTVSFNNYSLESFESFIITDGVSNNFSLKETLSRNSIDNPQFPRSGSNISLSLQLTPPYSLLNDKDYEELSDAERYKFIEYHKWRFTADWYTPAFGKFVFRASTKFGIIGMYNKEVGISPFERFQLGGDGLSNYNIYGTDIVALRGYDVFANSSGATANEPIFTKYTLELRYPISLNPSATIYGHAFAEGGNLYSSFDEFNPFEIKRSVGLGMRAFLPMFGLLGIDYGIRFDERVPGDLEPADGVFDYILKNGKFSIILGYEPD
ncbi:MAG: BamA/TamA family outer membrane protein [Fimbriimonadaceae bacterium]|nr:BamA/TamA family outer membrane protein [Chitinophagales bacterium]